MRKLAAERESDMIRAAVVMSFTDYPFDAHIRAASRLAEIDAEWIDVVQQLQAQISIYRERIGEPSPAMTFEELQRACAG